MISIFFSPDPFRLGRCRPPSGRSWGVDAGEPPKKKKTEPEPVVNHQVSLELLMMLKRDEFDRIPLHSYMSEYYGH